MRRFGFYILAALLTFGVGSFVAFRLSVKTENKVVTAQEISKQSQKSPTSFYGFTSALSTQIPEEKTLQKRFCKDKHILPVWNELKKDDYFRRQ